MGLEVIFGVHFVDLQEPVLHVPVIDEGGLQIGVDVVDDAFVDVAPDLGLMGHLHVVLAHGAVFGEHHLDHIAGQDADQHLAVHAGRGGLGGLAALLGVLFLFAFLGGLVLGFLQRGGSRGLLVPAAARLARHARRARLLTLGFGGSGSGSVVVIIIKNEHLILGNGGLLVLQRLLSLFGGGTRGFAAAGTGAGFAGSLFARGSGFLPGFSPCGLIFDGGRGFGKGLSRSVGGYGLIKNGRFTRFRRGCVNGGLAFGGTAAAPTAAAGTAALRGCGGIAFGGFGSIGGSGFLRRGDGRDGGGFGHGGNGGRNRLGGQNGSGDGGNLNGMFGQHGLFRLLRLHRRLNRLFRLLGLFPGCFRRGLLRGGAFPCGSLVRGRGRHGLFLHGLRRHGVLRSGKFQRGLLHGRLLAARAAGLLFGSGLGRGFNGIRSGGHGLFGRSRLFRRGCDLFRIGHMFPQKNKKVSGCRPAGAGGRKNRGLGRAVRSASPKEPHAYGPRREKAFPENTEGGQGRKTRVSKKFFRR